MDCALPELIMEKLFALREWQQDDIPAIVENANNKKIHDMLRDTFPFPYTENDAKKWITLHLYKSPATSFAITINGKVAGAIGVHQKEDVYRKSMELGYWLGEPYWGKGLAVQAVKEISAYAFTTFDVNRLFACVFAGNIASMRVLQKAGFILEGIHRSAVIKNDRILDEHVYALLKT
jgi:ribosomal-protein-alanine N-acetyltransferase